MRTRYRLAPIAAAALVLAGCAAPSTTTAAADPAAPVAVTTTTMLGSVVSDITACAGGTTKTLMPVGVDPHEFSLSSADVATMVEAKLVIANGLGLEAGLSGALENVQRDGGAVYEVGPDVDPEKLTDPSPEASQSGSFDPHFWLDASRMAVAATTIGEQLQEATGDHRYAACGVQVSGELKKLDAELRDILSAVPADRRVLVTDHDALGYFASSYRFSVAAVVVPGGSTDAEPSSAELASVVETVRTSGVHAIFSNSTVSPALVEAVSEEAGGVQVVPLYVDSIGPADSEADSYAGMMRTNAQRIADALA